MEVNKSSNEKKFSANVQKPLTLAFSKLQQDNEPKRD